MNQAQSNPLATPPMSNKIEEPKMEHTGSSTTTILEPAKGWHPVDFKSLWEYRELLWVMGARDIRVRYKQTFLGASWAIIQPFFTMVVFSIFFGRLGKMTSDNIPYPVFSFCALLPWQLFAYSLAQCGNSLVNNENLIKKVYFPRLIIPLAAILTGLLDFAIAFLVLIALMAYYKIVPSANIIFLPIFVLFAITTALAVGLLLAAINVQFRDVRHVLPFLTQFWLFLSPVVYSSSIIPEKWRLLYGLNPMAGVIEGFRWTLLGKSSVSVEMILASIVTMAVLLVVGVFYFQHVEERFADLV